MTHPRKLVLPLTASLALAVSACSANQPVAAPAPPAAPAPAPSSSAPVPTTPAPSPASPSPATPSEATTPGAGNSAAPKKSGAPKASASAAPPTNAKTEKARGVQPPPGAPVDCSAVKCVALTFDDGPGKDTPRVLQALTSRGAVATFFMQGPSLRTYPDIARQVAQTPGMELGEHSWTHPQLTGLSRDGVTKQLSQTHGKIKEITGKDVTVFRPPYGARNAMVDGVAKGLGESVVLWDADTMDWKLRNAAKVRAEAKRLTRPGSIVLMHDIHSTTVDAVPGIVDDLKAEGYVFVTVTQLMGGSTTPGKVYLRRD